MDPQPVSNKQIPLKQESFKDFVILLLEALAIALLIKTFLFQTMYIPSGSMKPTLLHRDVVFVSKMSYGYSRYSFPFGLPLFSGRIWTEGPERGDVAVFRNPRDTNIDYIKRVIGLPGETIAVRNGIVSINGEPVSRQPVADCDLSLGEGTSPNYVACYEETLPEGQKFTVADYFQSRGDQFGPIKLGPDEYFMMGDHRDNSEDSRFIGPVPLENFVGQAKFIALSFDDDFPWWQIWNWVLHSRPGRFGTGL